MIPLLGLNDVTHTVDDIDRAIQFYTEAMGLILDWKSEGNTSAILNFRRSEDTVYLETRWIDPGVHVGYRVRDVRAFVAEYEKAGHTAMIPPNGDKYHTYATIQDLDGNEIEISDSKPFDSTP